ncbi:MAG: hypothetical protein GXO65_01975 [Euryarchaeota archaeon]|nr:hypothetical protein [Euryarchaeota archaeon]
MPVILLTTLVFVGGCLQDGGGSNFPEAKEEFPVQGLYWRTVSYYYYPGIYGDLYNHEDNLRFVKKARDAGANYLLLRVFYNGTGEGGLVGDDEAAELYLGDAIKTAHEYGLGVLLVPYVESREYWVTKKWVLSGEEYSRVVLRWAEFAEENDVEMFAPGVEMSIIMDADEAGEWLRAILPRIREVYTGQVAVIEHPYLGRPDLLDAHDAFAGYDCLGMTVFPWKKYEGGEIDIRSIEDYEKEVEEIAQMTDDLGERYGIDCRLAAPLGLDFWQGEEPTPEVLVEVYGRGLDILKAHGFTGVFLFHWASEHDHLGESREVEAMLRERWTKSQGGAP